VVITNEEACNCLFSRGGGGHDFYGPNNYHGGGGGGQMQQTPPFRPPFSHGPAVPPLPPGVMMEAGDPLMDFVPGHVMRTRDLMYRLIISQLFYDGHQQVALQLTNLMALDACPPSERLLHVVTLGLEREADSRHRTMTVAEVVTT
jgi:hypothetical protein